MNRPFILVRILGAPLVALPVFLLCCALLVSWYQGHTPWQIALLAAGTAYRTYSAAKRMRSYKAWCKAWQAMGPGDEKTRPSSLRSISSIITTVPLLFAFGFPLYMGSLPSHRMPMANESMLTFLWGLSCIYIVVRLGLAFMRRRAGRRNAKNQPVDCLVSKPSSCPTRISATRALPEYCARLLSGPSGKGHLGDREDVSLSAG